MSKFFKALENADRERSSDGAAKTAASAPRPTPEVETSPAAQLETATIVAEPPLTTTLTPVAAPPPMPAVMPAPMPVVAPAVEPPVTSPAVKQPAYGAPIVRDAPAGAKRAWEGLLEPLPVSGERGEIDDHLVSLLEPTSLAAEQYRTIRLQIENLRRERGVRLVAISSPGRSDGKTTTAINVAGALAQSPDARVALVEVDVRHPGVARCLGLSGGRGLSTYLIDPAMAVDDVLERPASIGFAVVVAGPVSSMPYELLKSPRLTGLFAALRERFDYVVVDTPPVLPFPDVGILRDLVDGFVLVVRANRTPREMVRDSLATVGAHRVLGAIFNEDERIATTAGQATNEAGWRGYLSRPLGNARAA